MPLFSDLEQEELERFSRVAVPRAFPAATRVFHEGDHSDACYIVRSGSFRVTREHSDGRAITLATLGAGDIFGELAMLDGEVRSASVEALVDGELLALPAGEVRALLARHPEITVKLVAALVRRLRTANERISRQSFQTVPSRVAGVLSQLVAEEAPRGRRRRRGDDPHEPGRPGPARRHLAGERQPLPRRPRAGRDRAARAAAGSPCSTRRSSTTTSTEGRRPVDDYPALRAGMVERQLRRRGIDDERVLAAMGAVPRELFVPAAPPPPRLRRLGAADRRGADDLPALDRRRDLPGAAPRAASERVLEVGTGSGYSAAVLALLAARGDRDRAAAGRSPRGARRAIAELGLGNVEVIVGDGSRGLPERAPFDAIAVHAAAPAPPRTLLGQLAEGGRLVVPIADRQRRRAHRLPPPGRAL